MLRFRWYAIVAAAWMALPVTRTAMAQSTKTAAQANLQSEIRSAQAEG